MKMLVNAITQVFLNKDSSHGELFDASRDLAGFFGEISSISTKDNHLESNDSTHTNLKTGVAISPLDAAICINEYMRTTKYIRGVFDAINDLLIRFKDEKIHLLYAGTGPYATLVTPLLHLFDSNRLEVTFLDIHQSSLDSVKDILTTQKICNFAKDYVCTDATTYKCESKVHLIVTETMRLAFEGEPQVNITLNLLPQLCEDGVFIPECVNIHLESSLKKLVQKENSLENIKKSDFLADIIKLDTKKQWNKENLILTPTLKIKEDIKDGYDLFFCTQIQVYKNHILNENECSLNLPLFLLLSSKVIKGDVLEFSYELENRPEILYKHKKIGTSFVADQKNFYPTGLSYRYKEPTVIWQEIANSRFLKPFFSDETKTSKKKYISFKELEDIVSTSKYLEPKGFIFHTSRCGSTLLSNALSSLEKNIVIKESAFIHDILTLDYKNNISSDEIKEKLVDAIRVLGRKRFDFEENFFIKFNSWEIEHIKLIKELYPNTPIIILYRNPLEILNSHKKLSGMQMVPTLLNGKIFDSIEKETLFNEYPMRVLENIFEEITLQKNEKNTMIINYEDIKKIFFSKIAPFFNLVLNKQEKETIQYSFNLYSKNSSLNFDINNEIIDKTITISSKLQKSFKLLETIKES